MGGVCIEDTKHSSIGDGVILDSLYPENIIIHNQKGKSSSSLGVGAGDAAISSADGF